MKILLLGKDGQVGWELQRSLSELGEIIACGRDEADFLNPGMIRDLLLKIKPDVVVNAAAYTAVDLAEKEYDLANQVNHKAVAVIADSVKEINALLVHYSTDYVFDGAKTEPYLEDDATNPLSVYGETKRKGELAILESQCRAIIFRTSWVYGLNGNNFAKTMLNLFSLKNEISVINDQFGAPTGADLIADVTADVLTSNTMPKLTCEIYNLVAAGQTNWYAYAQFIMQEAKLNGHVFNFDLDKIHPISHTEYKVASQRPENSRLSVEKLEKALDLKMPDWKMGVKKYLKQLLVKEEK